MRSSAEYCVFQPYHPWYVVMGAPDLDSINAHAHICFFLGFHSLMLVYTHYGALLL